MRQPAVYIMSNKRHGTLYIGVTNDLVRRVQEHKQDIHDGFTKQYGLHKLVYFETCEKMIDAIEREKHLKKWVRKWKIELIEKQNPKWLDLYENIL